MVNAKTFLEKRYSEDMELEDAIHTALLTLKEGFEGAHPQIRADLCCGRGVGWGKAGPGCRAQQCVVPLHSWRVFTDRAETLSAASLQASCLARTLRWL
jgi:hypothetical protein